MRSNIKFLIAVTIALVVLIGAVIVLLNVKTEGDVEEETTTQAVTESPSRLLYEKNKMDIDEIDVTNETGSYKIKKYAEDAWFVEEFSGLVHDTAAISAVLGEACTLTSSQVASEGGDMSVYGLDKPIARARVTFGDGTVKGMSIGSDAPTKGLVYVRLDDADTVYAVDGDSVDCFFKDRFYYLEKTVYRAKTAENPDDKTDYKKINSITIKRSDIDYDIVLEYDIRQESEEIVTGNSATHIMTSPVRLDLNPDKAYEVLNNIFGLKASGVAVIGPSEDTLKKFGFDEPLADISFDIVGGNAHLVVGSEFSDGYYCMADGFDMIFTFDKTSVPWATVMPTDITMPLITSNYIYTIHRFDITLDGSDLYSFVPSGDKDDFSVTYTRPNADVNEPQTMDADGFKSFYQYFLKAPAEEIYLDECDDEPFVKVVIEHDYGTDTVEFIRSENRMSIVRLNGVTSFKCRTAYADRLAENLTNLMEGRDIIITW